MPGTYAKPKAYNRIWWIDVRAAEQPEWAKIAVGISSRGNSINEQSQDYYDMEGRGVAESEVTSVAVTRTFTGWRAIGGKAVLSITDDGSGDAQNRENISFALKILGTPEKGTVTVTNNVPTFTPATAASGG